VALCALQVSYYSSILKADRYTLNATELQSYFRYAAARSGVFYAAQRLFHVHFERVHGAPAWHDNVSR
jgi:Zn-dependent oligopeptidase